jgi:hypothetical protein
MEKRSEAQTSKFISLAQLTIVAALICSLWIVCRFYSDHGLAAALGAFFGLAVAYRIGPETMFGVAASILALQFNVWIPLVAYAILKVMLVVDFQWERPQQKTMWRHLLGSAGEV